MRCFLAIELPNEIREQVGDLLNSLRPELPTRVSWVKPENLHLTLRFLGEVQQPQLDALVACWNDCEEQLASLSLSVSGVGVFPKTRGARVLWAGVNEPVGHLSGVYAACEAAARTIGVTPESRKFSPHITLARFRDASHPATLRKMLEQYRDWSAGEFAVEAVSLFRSELTPRGAVYTRLETLPLPWISPPEPSTTS